jgi:hypothetical protein
LLGIILPPKEDIISGINKQTSMNKRQGKIKPPGIALKTANKKSGAPAPL